MRLVTGSLIVALFVLTISILSPKIYALDVLYQNSTTGLKFQYPASWQKQPDKIGTNTTSIALSSPRLIRSYTALGPQFGE